MPRGSAVQDNAPAPMTFTMPGIGAFIVDYPRCASIGSWDAVMSKRFAVSIKDHRVTTEFRAEFYNLFNHPQFAAPNGSVSSQSFGQVTSIANAPRDLQFGLKIGF